MNSDRGVMVDGKEFRNPITGYGDITEKPMGKMFSIKDGDISDTYHTFSELYQHRNSLFLLLCLQNPDISFWRPDYEGHFLLYLELVTGQISYHLGNELLPYIEGKIQRDDDHKWDGHTPTDTINRLLQMATI